MSRLGRRRYPLLTALVIGAMLPLASLLVGCKTNAEIRQEFDLARPDVRPNSNVSLAQPSSNQVLGRVVWTSPDNSRAVVYLESSTIDPKRTLVARDKAREPTALLQPSGTRRDNSLGVTVAYGKPLVGDEVLLREAVELPREWGYAPTSDTTAGSDTFPFILPNDNEPPTRRTTFVKAHQSADSPSSEKTTQAASKP